MAAPSRAGRSFVLDSMLLPVLLALAVGCERPPVEADQGHFRGLAMEQVSNPRTVEALREANQVPEPLPPIAAPSGRKAGEALQNVQALAHVDVLEFGRTMTALTSWVSPEQGCLYCHAGANFAAEAPEAPYTKAVSRRMIQMTQHINADWKDHVGETGVTCYTCHRGMVIPSNYWFYESETKMGSGWVGSRAGQNEPSNSVGLASLPSGAFTRYFSGDEEIRVQSAAALPNGNDYGVKQTEHTYGLMIHLSTSLGVNCTYCHNSRSFMPWEASTPQRVNAWYGIRMVRQLNTDYMDPLSDTFPEHRKGPEGDAFKINCTTCHQGVAKPLYGVSMLKDYPALMGPE